MNITVYLGANEGNDPCLRKAVEELGAWIGNSGNALVYGGSKGGLMGALANSVLKAGGDVTGVEPNFFIENEFQHDGLTKLIVTKDMSERKNKMIELGEAFIAFPGGKVDMKKLSDEYDELEQAHNTTYGEFKTVRDDLHRLWKVKSCVDTAARFNERTEEQKLQNRPQTRQKKEDMTR